MFSFTARQKTSDYVLAQLHIFYCENLNIQMLSMQTSHFARIAQVLFLGYWSSPGNSLKFYCHGWSKEPIHVFTKMQYVN